MEPILLSRDEFKNSVFKRDGHACTICKKDSDLDAHHIIDRSLWGESQGYFIDNGVTLCPGHHVEAEMTTLPCQRLRDAAGIPTILLPEHFYSDEKYDHWGNIVLPTGMRIKGELFWEENVQRILGRAGVLNQFLKYVKYPRTYHTPYSENLQNDDRMHQDMFFFNGKKVVVTEKMDGECTTLYRDYIHARSVDSKHHDSRSWIKQLHGAIAREIPDNYRVCGENLYAEHSIHYSHLKDYFYVYSIWDDKNTALSWDETLEWCDLLGLCPVPEIYMGTWDKEAIHDTFIKYRAASKDLVEGYVIRLTDRIKFRDYRLSFAKWVRQGHVITDEFWMKRPVIPNEIDK